MQEELSYVNPLAPESVSRLTNDDFRKLLATPRAVSATATSRDEKSGTDTDKKTKKKTYIPKVKREENEKAAELASKYRDRAKERREGVNPDYQEVDNTLSMTSGYKAVAPDADLSTIEERRRREIEESKFLGGDLKHTHLVKGLDYVLKQKKLESMHVKQEEDEVKKTVQKRKESENEEEVTFHTAMAKNIYRTLFVSRPPVRNELFAPGRMAYVFELDDEYMESDIPTTLIRSKADCPQAESHSLLSTNDIVINKLTQILSYLRTGVRGKKAKRKDKGKVEELVHDKVKKTKSAEVEMSIWDDIGDYVLDTKKQGVTTKKKGSYFDGSNEKESDDVLYKPPAAQEVVKSLAKKYDRTEGRQGSGGQKGGMIEAGWSSADIDFKKQLAGDHDKGPSTKTEEDKSGKLVGLENSALGTYAECYPGGLEEMDTAYDSDEDADYTKMDLGNKKGPVKRWDFENEEDYATYQSSREALPKAAFQYGVKMNEGRKTRRSKGGKNDMAKINREWQQISAILSKRKGGSGGKADEHSSVSKKAKEDIE